jgi:hypothetical protein
MKCYFCQSDMISTMKDYLCPTCPQETRLNTPPNTNKDYVYMRYAIKNKNYSPSWTFANNQLESFRLFTCTPNSDYDADLYTREYVYELILQLTEGIDKITPQNVIEKMNTYLPFL